jgi:rRNA maturation endonuclease Nob1
VPDAESQALLEKIHHDQEIAQDIAQHSHERVVRTPEQIAEEERREALQAAEAKRLAEEAEKHRIAEEELARKSRANTAPDAILKELSHSDLKVSTLASQAKYSAEATNEDGEVVISLH